MLFPHDAFTYPQAPQMWQTPVRAGNRGTTPSLTPLLRVCPSGNKCGVYRLSCQLVKHPAPPKPQSCSPSSPSSRRCWRHWNKNTLLTVYIDQFEQVKSKLVYMTFKVQDVKSKVKVILFQVSCTNCRYQ